MTDPLLIVDLSHNLQSLSCSLSRGNLFIEAFGLKHRKIAKKDIQSNANHTPLQLVFIKNTVDKKASLQKVVSSSTYITPWSTQHHRNTECSQPIYLTKCWLMFGSLPINVHSLKTW